jgi:CBS domain containing-hemolysin-like protein
MELIYTLFALMLLMIVLVYLSGWFSGTETALTNLGIAQVAEMRRNGEKNAGYVIKLKKEIDRAIVTILIGNNVVNILLSALAALIANSMFQALGVSIMIGLITFLILIFGEITPKANAVMNSKKIAQKNAKAVYYLMQALSPVITVFMAISRKIIVLTGGKIREKHMFVSDESIKSLATLGEEEGSIKSIERDIIHKVFIFGDRKIREIMVPMPNVFYLKKDCTIREAKETIARRGFTRVPIVDENGNVTGIIYGKDLIGKEGGQIKPLIRHPVFVPAESDITDIFNEMKKRRVHIAIVKDENEKHIGIVTLEDILEELVGEIHDEYSEVKYKRQKV